ncbi:MAG: hypothetical protein WAK26_00500 [Terracidiphilus sp.]
MTPRVHLRNNTPLPISVNAFNKGLRNLPKWVGALAACLLLLAISGCNATLFSTKTTTDPAFSNFTGNWVLQFTPTSGPTEFTQLSGFINDIGGPQLWATAAFQGTLQDCFAGQTFTPWYGNINGTAMNLYSFLITGEMLTATATSNADFTQFTGNYTLGGPCADGETGTVVGTHYETLTGTYSGSLSSDAGQSLQLDLTQNTVATGNGTFFVTGSAKLQGFSCFSSATIASYAGTVVGSNVQLQFTTNESPSSTLTISGAIDPTADTLTANSIQVSGGECSGSLGGASLTRQSN